MSLTDILMVLSVLIAPVLAVNIQRRLDTGRERRSRREYIFSTLMATRAARVSPEHVRALNMIDMEFGKNKDRKVREEWNCYRDHLNTVDPAEEPKAWIDRGDERLSKLLLEMARTLNYTRFEELTVRKGCYSPAAHGDIEFDNLMMRRGIVDLLEGKRSLGIHYNNEPVIIDAGSQGGNEADSGSDHKAPHR